MSIFNKFFGKKEEGAEEGKQDMSAMARDPRMLAMIGELQGRLSSADQRELFRRIMSRNQQSVQEFMTAKIPDWQDMLKKHGLL